MRLILIAALLANLGGKDDYVVRTWKRIKVTDKFYAEGAHAGDFNKDGKMDVVAGSYWIEGPEFTKVREYTEVKEVDPKGYSKNFFAFTHDFNKDGWTDILIYGFPGEDASWYENPQGKDGHWKRNKVIDKLDNESPQFEDVNGDKIPDVVASTGGQLGYWTISDWKFHPIAPADPKKYQRYTHGLGVGDINGDGKTDFLEKDGWWEQPKDLGGDPLWAFHKVPFGSGGAQMYAYDLNGDGLNDVITSIQAHGYGLSWFEQTKDGGFKEHVIMGKKSEDNKYGVKFSQPHAVDLVDMDGDGVKDIITGKRWWAHGPKGDQEPDAAAVLYWFKVVKGPTPDFIPHRVDDDSGIGVQVQALDLNGDKLPDIVVGNKKGIYVHLQVATKVSKEEFDKAQPKPIK